MAAVKAAVPEIPAAVSELSATKLVYFDHMWALESSAAFLSRFQVEDGRSAVILDSTIFHPQGGGQPADTGSISTPYSEFVFVVEDVRLKDGLVFHYGLFEGGEDGLESKLKEGQKVTLHVNGQRRDLNSRLHSAGHLLDICMRNVGLSYLEPGKGYHFPDGPFVEYRGIIPHDQLQNKKDELEKEANALICKGGKVSASILPYEEATKWCGGDLPIYISKSSTPRIVKLGENPGCPCGGTHVADISDIRGLKFSLDKTHIWDNNKPDLDQTKLAHPDKSKGRAIRDQLGGPICFLILAGIMRGNFMWFLSMLIPRL